MSAPVRETPAAGYFSFEPDNVFQPIIEAADVEIGLEVASLEERHYEYAGADETLKLAEQIDGLRKFVEAREELLKGLQDTEEGARDFAVVRFATRMLRVGHVVAERRAERRAERQKGGSE